MQTGTLTAAECKHRPINQPQMCSCRQVDGGSASGKARPDDATQDYSRRETRKRSLCGASPQASIAMGSSLGHRLLVLLLACCACCYGGSAPQLVWMSCPAGQGGTDCAAPEVPLDPSGGVLGHVTIFIRRFYTSAPTGKSIWMLSGGPGDSANSFSPGTCCVVIATSAVCRAGLIALSIRLHRRIHFPFY